MRRKEGEGLDDFITKCLPQVTSRPIILYAQYYSVLLIERDVTRGKHHAMKSSRPSPSFLCVESKVAIQLIAGKEKAWNRGYTHTHTYTHTFSVHTHQFTYAVTSTVQDVCFPLVEGVLDGYNGTVFAYGQTGCGKSYTMMGVEEPAANRWASGRSVSMQEGGGLIDYSMIHSKCCHSIITTTMHPSSCVPRPLFG